VYVGDLIDVLETNWMVRATVKMHNFWEFRVFTDRLACTAEKFAITVEVRPEAWISQECPNCGSATETTRHQDTLTCPCGFEGYANLTASEMFLRRHESNVPRSIARFACPKWDDHRGRRHHTLTVLTRSIQTRKLLPGNRRSRPPRWNPRASARGGRQRDVKVLLSRFFNL